MTPGRREDHAQPRATPDVRAVVFSNGQWRQLTATCATTSAEPDHILHPLPEPCPIRSLFKLSRQVTVVSRIAGGLHDRLRQRGLFGEGVVEQKVGRIGFSLSGISIRGWKRYAFAQDVLKVTFSWAEAIDGPAGENAGVVLAYYLLYYEVSGKWCRVIDGR